MRHVIVILFITLATLYSSLPHFAQGAQAPFRATVDVVSLNVTVLNGKQGYVGDLNVEDFVVLENGAPQNIIYFAKTTVPLAVSLLIDSSASMDQALLTAQNAAIGFTRTINEADLVSVIDFDSRVEVVQAFTGNQRLLEDGIRRSAAGGSTALYNALYIALNELKKVTIPVDEGRVRRRAVVVLSDGEDTSSLVTFEEILDAASRSDTLVYTIGLGITESTGARAVKEGAFVLRRLAEQTGGRAFFPKDAKELAGVYTTVRQDLASQYSLAYQSSNGQRDGAWRRIGVRVNRPSAVVRTRQGYYAPSR